MCCGVRGECTKSQGRISENKGYKFNVLKNFVNYLLKDIAVLEGILSKYLTLFVKESQKMVRRKNMEFDAPRSLTTDP